MYVITYHFPYINEIIIAFVLIVYYIVTKFAVVVLRSARKEFPMGSPEHKGLILGMRPAKPTGEAPIGIAEIRK